MFMIRRLSTALAEGMAMMISSMAYRRAYSGMFSVEYNTFTRPMRVPALAGSSSTAMTTVASPDSRVSRMVVAPAQPAPTTITRRSMWAWEPFAARQVMRQKARPPMRVTTVRNVMMNQAMMYTARGRETDFGSRE